MMKHSRPIHSTQLQACQGLNGKPMQLKGRRAALAGGAASMLLLVLSPAIWAASSAHYSAPTGNMAFDEKHDELKLTGILLTVDHPLALIEAQGKQRLFSIGDRLPDGALLKTIADDRITATAAHGDFILYIGSGRGYTQQNTTSALPQKAQTTRSLPTGFNSQTAKAEDISVSSTAATSKETIHPNWVIPAWLQQGKSGPTAPESLQKSPWSSK